MRQQRGGFTLVEVLVGFANRVAFLYPDTLESARQGWATGDEILDARYTPDGRKILAPITIMDRKKTVSIR